MKYNIRIRVGNEIPSFGKGVMELLDLCDQYGSLSKAYKEMGMSNSKAWKILKRAQEDLGYELVSSTSGGSHGGGSTLTPRGKELLHQYKTFKTKVEMYADTVFKEVFDDE